MTRFLIANEGKKKSIHICHQNSPGHIIKWSNFYRLYSQLNGFVGVHYSVWCSTLFEFCKLVQMKNSTKKKSSFFLIRSSTQKNIYQWKNMPTTHIQMNTNKQHFTKILSFWMSSITFVKQINFCHRETFNWCILKKKI